MERNNAPGALLNAIKYRVIFILLLYLVLGNLFSCATRKRIGAECCDETYSTATGTGACSWHGGVRQWRYEYWYTKLEEPYKSIFKITIPGTIGFSGHCKDE